MSLLLDALKKAEKAKEEAQRAKGEASPAAQPAAPPPQPAAQPMELRLQDDPEPPAPRHVTTRAELPDISQPLQILSDDIGPEKSPRGAPAPKRTAPGAAPAGRAQGAQAADGAAQERAAARKVFEAKY